MHKRPDHYRTEWGAAERQPSGFPVCEARASGGHSQREI